ncbi:MAG TPA: 2-oxoacid:acceptor oxidoreductase family protein [Synergistaceae bacterium]|nr:2-oxoacid:acceptor oxidoreductase family protein [Synergistaceae bacterium]HPX02992.1 2-oxoacid:acceptor oxidoreductase family protein [Synergistaceae bacterium]HQA55259.1 2-oxoacid:acceptor oxidoreductase family protein [Synergistaceae bacterium]
MSDQTRTLFCAGFGGQGVMVLGQLVAYGAMKEGKFVTWLPSYGPEMRGGTANCGVTVSSRPIGSPFVASADVVVALNQPSLDKYEASVKTGGFLIYNSDMAKYTPTRDDIRVIPVNASQIAGNIGNEKAVNVILLGVVIAISDLISDDTAREIIKQKLGSRKPEFLESNMKAYEEGRKIGLSV